MGKQKKVAIFGFNEFTLTLAAKLNKHHLVFLVEQIEEHYRDVFEQIVVDLESERFVLPELDAIFVAHEVSEKNLFFIISASDNTKASIVSFDKIENEKKLLLAGATKVIDKDLSIASKLFGAIHDETLETFLSHVVFSNSTLGVEQIVIPKNSIFENRRLHEIDFSATYNLILLGMVDIENGDELLFVHKAENRILSYGDILVLMGDKKDIHKLVEGLKK